MESAVLHFDIRCIQHLVHGPEHLQWVPGLLYGIGQEILGL